MQIKFLENTYIRKAPVVDDSPVGVVYKGTVIEAEPVLVKGEEIEENDRWYCDKNGWYYWSGRTLIIRFGHTLPPGKGNQIEVDTESVEEIPEILSSETAKVEVENTILTNTVERPVEPEEAKKPLPSFDQPISGVAEEELSDSSGSIYVNPRLIWKTDQKDQLNWGVKNYSIAEDWWNARKLTGKGVRLAILSTGVSTDHPDLSNIAGLLQNGRVAEPMNDADGLGTQAAVVAAGAGRKVFGVAPEVDLFIAKLGEQDHMITPESVAIGLSWALDNQVDIIAILVDFPSLASAEKQDLEDLCQEASNRNIWVLAPVGNSNNKRPEDRYPAALPSVLSIGAHDQFGVKSTFSAKSYNLDIAAPGESLLTTNQQRQTLENSKSVSIAVAFTAGLLALIRQSGHFRGKPNEELFELLRATAVSRRPFSKGEDTEYGYGLLNPIEILKRIDPAYEGPWSSGV